MIKTGLTTILFLALTINNCVKAITLKTDTANTYTVTGKIRGYDNGWVYLSHTDKPKKGMKTDSAKIENGSFNFTGKVIGIEPFILGLRDKDSKGRQLPSIAYRGLFMLSKGHLYIEGESDSRTTLIAQGTIAQEEYNLFRAKLTPLNNKLNQIIRDRYTTKKSEIVKLDHLNTQYSLVRNEIKEIVKSHVMQYPNSLVSAYIAQSELSNTDPKTVKSIYDNFTLFVKESIYGASLLKIIQATSATAVGNTTPSFMLPNPTGQLVSLEESKGTYTLIDFWASWCGPCRRENPNLIRAYKSYQANGFKIISISMDTNKASWLKAVSEDELPWLQLSDLKGLQSETGKKYGITTIPMNFLINKEGKIIARDLTGAELINQLQKLL